MRISKEIMNITQNNCLEDPSNSNYVNYLLIKKLL